MGTTQPQTDFKKTMKNYLRTMIMSACCNLILGAAIVTIFYFIQILIFYFFPVTGTKYTTSFKESCSLLLDTIFFLAVWTKKSVLITATGINAFIIFITQFVNFLLCIIYRYVCYMYNIVIALNI